MSQTTMQVSEFDLDDAPEMPGGVFTNYGKLTITQKWVAWRDGTTVEVTRDEFKAIPAKVDGKGAKQIDMVFAIDIQEFKSSLSFTYARKVTVEGLDWNKIVVPSVEAAFGKGSMSRENRNATLSKLNGKYVSYQDVLQTPTKNKPNPTFNCFKLVKVYDTREACYADFVASGGNKVSSENGASDTGFGESAPVVLNPLIPAGFGNNAEAWGSMKSEVQVALASAETPLIEALNKKHAKSPAPLRKSKIESEMPSVRTDALAEVAKAKSAEWGVEVSAEQLRALIGA